jgi:hypothetical protein
LQAFFSKTACLRYFDFALNEAESTVDTLKEIKAQYLSANAKYAFVSLASAIFEDPFPFGAEAAVRFVSGTSKQKAAFSLCFATSLPLVYKYTQTLTRRQSAHI